MDRNGLLHELLIDESFDFTGLKFLIEKFLFEFFTRPDISNSEFSLSSSCSSTIAEVVEEDEEEADFDDDDETADAVSISILHRRAASTFNAFASCSIAFAFSYHQLPSWLYRRQLFSTKDRLFNKLPFHFKKILIGMQIRMQIRVQI